MVDREKQDAKFQKQAEMLRRNLALRKNRSKNVKNCWNKRNGKPKTQIKLAIKTPLR